MKTHTYRIVTILLLIFITSNARAQVVIDTHINHDEVTAEAMTEGFLGLIAAEEVYSSSVEKIRMDYEASLRATSTIFSQEFLERKAMTALTNWKNSQENYYYRRSHDMVQNHIIPAVWTIGSKMVKDPATALYWGPYMFTTIEDLKNLCYEFESIVTNSTLGFSDIDFIEFNPQIAALFQLSKMGGQDWKSVLQNFSIADDKFAKDNVKAAADNMKNILKNLPNTAVNNVSESVMAGAKFDGDLLSKIESTATVAENVSNLYRQLSQNGVQALTSILGIGDGDVSHLFVHSNYDIKEWANDYVRENVLSQYYTQHWYIYTKTLSAPSMKIYNPDPDKYLEKPWSGFKTKDGVLSLTDSQKQYLRDLANSWTGWSQQKVEELNRTNDYYHYEISYELVQKPYEGAAASNMIAAAYAVYVTSQTVGKTIVYDEIFDSRTSDWSTFETALNNKLANYNNNTSGKIYYVTSDDKHYYQAATEDQLRSCEQVIFSVTCNNETTITDGETKYPCSHVGKEGTLKPECKECSMLDSEQYTTEEGIINDYIAELNDHITGLRNAIARLEEENRVLTERIKTASQTDIELYQERIADNNAQLAILRKDLDESLDALEGCNNCIEQMEFMDSVQVNVHYRLNNIMLDLQSKYGITWTDQGSWTSYTYRRAGELPSGIGTVTFTADLQVVKPCLYLLGLKLRNGIVLIDWKLDGVIFNDYIAETLTFDESVSDKDKTTQVNNKLSEIMKENPDCYVSVDYIKSAPIDEDNTEDTYHLLWASDRLDIARDIDIRLSKIYADLVVLNKMLSYRYTIAELKQHAMNKLDWEQGKKESVIKESQKRWSEAAGYKPTLNQ